MSRAWDEAVLAHLFRKRLAALDAPVTAAELVAADAELRALAKGDAS